MTDEELRNARVEEAMRRWNGTAPEAARWIARTVLKLAEMGWTPDDPIEAEVKKLLAACSVTRTSYSDDLRTALLRGIELGKAP